MRYRLRTLLIVLVIAACASSCRPGNNKMEQIGQGIEKVSDHAKKTEAAAKTGQKASPDEN